MKQHDILRYLLFGALALMSFMLLVEWQQFKEQRTPAATTTEPRDVTPLDEELSPATLSDTSTDADFPERPAEDRDVSTTKSDLPTAIEISTDLIQVETDTMLVTIDLNGGDIVGLALRNHYAELDRPDLPFVLLENTSTRSYVAQSGLIGVDTSQARARYRAAAASFALAEGEDRLTVELVHDSDTGIRVSKRFQFTRGDYLVAVNHLIQNGSVESWRGNLFAQIRRDGSSAPAATDSFFSIRPFLGFATRTSEEPYRKFSLEDIAKAKWSEKMEGGWIAMVQHYFISAWIPDDPRPQNFSVLKTSSGMHIGRFTSPAIQIEAGDSATVNTFFYAGPKDQYRLQKIAAGLDLTVDYGWLWWLAQPLFALLSFFATGSLHLFGWTLQVGNGLGNWGWSIVLLTVLIKALFFHLSAASYRSMAKMRKLQPKMLELRERYGDDRQKMSQATMELYRKEKVNPLGGCLPILIQMPVFIALYWMLMESVELRQAPFMLWIRDLSVMDPYFVLPLLMGASMFVQQKLNPPPPDPMQARIFQLMPIMFTVFFLWFPAGLVLYWLVNNLLSILQQWVITRRIEKEA